MKLYPIVPRLLAVFLSVSLAAPSPALALRQNQLETGKQRSGLEEALLSGNPDEAIDAIGRLAQVVPPVPPGPLAPVRPEPSRGAGLEEKFPDPALVGYDFKAQVDEILRQRDRGFDRTLAALITANLPDDSVGQEKIGERNRARAIHVLWRLDTEILQRVRPDEQRDEGQLYYDLLFGQQEETYRTILGLLGKPMVEGSYLSSYVPPAEIDLDRVSEEHRGLRDLRYEVALTLVRLDTSLPEYYSYHDRASFVFQVEKGTIRFRQDIIRFIKPIIERLEHWEKEGEARKGFGYNKLAVLSALSTLKNLAGLRELGQGAAEPYRSWMQQGVEIQITWKDPITGEARTNAGKIRDISNLPHFPVIWLEGLDIGIYLRSISRATPTDFPQGSTPTPPKPSGLEETIRETQEKRLDEIQKYLRGKLQGEERKKFVGEIDSNQTLRWAVIRTRGEQPELHKANVALTPEAAIKAFDEGVEEFETFNRNSPGSNFVSGIEFEDRIVYKRGQAFVDSEKAFQQVLTFNVLEDLVFENLWMINQNRAKVTALESQQPGNSVRGMRQELDVIRLHLVDFTYLFLWSAPRCGRQRYRVPRGQHPPSPPAWRRWRAWWPTPLVAMTEWKL